MTFTKDDVLISINIALTDELLHAIEQGTADVYLDMDSGVVRMATDIDTEPRRFTIRVEEVK